MNAISEAAFLSRVRRRLAQEHGGGLKVARRAPSDYMPDRYTAFDDRNNCIGTWSSFDDLLAAWSDDDGVLRPGEHVAGWEHVTASAEAA